MDHSKCRLLKAPRQKWKKEKDGNESELEGWLIYGLRYRAGEQGVEGGGGGCGLMLFPLRFRSSSNVVYLFHNSPFQSKSEIPIV